MSSIQLEFNLYPPHWWRLWPWLSSSAYPVDDVDGPDSVWATVQETYFGFSAFQWRMLHIKKHAKRLREALIWLVVFGAFGALAVVEAVI